MAKVTITKQDVKKAADDNGLQADDAQFALNYINYYYINPEVVKSFSANDLPKYTKEVQKLYGLKASGKLNSQTIKVMRHAPRCGCPDYKMTASSGRSR
jgi:hypothetical protein